MQIQRDPEGRPLRTVDSAGETLSHFGQGHGALPIEVEGPEGRVLELAVEGIRLGQLREGSTRVLPLFTDQQGAVL